jgi:hypothetical protein
MNPETVRKRINKLKKLGICTTQSTSHYTIITIAEWHTYQGDEVGKVPPKVPPKYQQSTTNKHNKNNKKNADSRISALVSFFHDEVLGLKGFKPQIDGGDSKAVQKALKGICEAEIREAISFFLRSEKAEKSGVTLKAALSTHSLNQWKQSRRKSDWQTV